MKIRVLQPIVACLALAVGATTAHAQATLQNATVFGTVRDASGGVLPGVTVEMTSPALQATQSATTDVEGNYRITNLPAGTYRLAFSLVGFQTEVRSGFGLTAGFAARVDIALKLGALEESIEVSGASPLIDTSTSASSTSLPRATLDAVPTTRSIYQAVFLAPGIRPPATPDVGGSQLGSQQTVGGYGYFGNVTLLIDGINGLQNNSINGNAAPGNFVDYDSLEEFRVISTGAEAEIATAGPVIITTMKSGGNDFHGGGRATYQPRWFQATNLPDGFAGGKDSNQLQYYWDAFGDLGGRIIRDKLWFYGAVHLQRNNSAVVGYVGRDGRQGFNPGQQDNSEAKVTYQATTNLKFIADYTRATKANSEYMGSASVPFASTYNYSLPFWNWKGEMTYTRGGKWLFDALGGNMWQCYAYTNQPDMDTEGNPWTVNTTTGLTSGATHNTSSNDRGCHFRQQFTGSISYYPTGGHSFMFGTHLYAPQGTSKEGFNHPSGNYQLVTQGATTAVPYQLITYNYPWKIEGHQRSFGIYAKDTWRMTDRLTVNYGVRFDWNQVYNTAADQPPGPFSAGGDFPYQKVQDRRRVSPRLGVAYDLTGNGRTVIRGSYGLYNIDNLGIWALTNYNAGGFRATTYSWAGDTCQTTAYTNCAPSAAFLAALAGPGSTFNGQNIYITTTGGLNGIVNPDLRMAYFQTATAALEQELTSTLALRLLYVANVEENMYDSITPNRPITSYTEAYNTVYPATDPVNGGAPITINYYPSSLSAANQTMLVNRVGKPDYFNTIEGTVTKRLASGWSASASVGFTKKHKWLPTTSPAIFASGQSGAQPVAPHQEAFPLDETWDWTFKSHLTYDLPHGITSALNYQLLAGAPNYAVDQFNGVPSLGTVYIPVERFGAERNPAIHMLNLKLGQRVSLPGARSLEFSVELFNVLNAATPLTVNYINGTGTRAFGYVSEYMPPMVGRMGVQFKF